MVQHRRTKTGRSLASWLGGLVVAVAGLGCTTIEVVGDQGESSGPSTYARGTFIFADGSVFALDAPSKLVALDDTMSCNGFDADHAHGVSLDWSRGSPPSVGSHSTDEPGLEAAAWFVREDGTTAVQTLTNGTIDIRSLGGGVVEATFSGESDFFTELERLDDGAIFCVGQIP